jgi:hypothetical protein
MINKPGKDQYRTIMREVRKRSQEVRETATS